MTQKQGIAALEAGDFGAAVSLLSAAAESDPSNGTIRYNLAQALRYDDREGEAIIQATHALARDQTLLPAARLLAFLLSHLRLRNPCGIDPVGLAASFCLKGVDHQVLAPTAVAYLKQCTDLGKAVILGGASGWDCGAQWLLSSKGRPVLRDPLLLTILCTTANTDLAVECLLTALRKSLLLAPAKETLRKPHILNFIYALARQGEINEYVFAVSDEELLRLDNIFINLQGIRDNSRTATDNLLLKALYFPFCRLVGNEGKDIDAHRVKPKALGSLIHAHLVERRTVEEAARDIKSVGIIEDEVSRNVACLYEENPYPRWLSFQLPTPASRHKQIIEHFSKQELAFMDLPYKVLIGGAGTGQQAIDSALGYGHKAALTAIDISLSSLAYAKYMADRFKADNLCFVQCDILNSNLLDDVFDIIESIGVLHHMDDPWRGWKVLIEKLRPGGLMKIGLYSRAARSNIASLRTDIQAGGLNGDEQVIRDYRQGVLAEGEEGKRAFLLDSADFYSLSNFRDLMFHVKELHLTIPEISSFMADNNLTFHGFQIPIDIAKGYPDGDARLDLERWQEFEVAHPETFKGMYVFWCRKG
jgi:SAM-dependent methyltransferase